MKVDLRAMTRRFLLGEEKKSPRIVSYIQNLGEILDNFKPKTNRENRRLEIAKTQLREIRRLAKRLEERVGLLEEELRILEEDKK